MKKSLQIRGPFATEYSLARVNRALVRAINNLNTDYFAYHYAPAKEIDRLPSSKEFKKYPELKDVYKSNASSSEVCIYNNFPKSITANFGFDSIKSNLKLAYLAWEESILPEHFVSEINSNLHGIMVTSSFVKRIFANSGVKVPLINISEGIDFSLETKSDKISIKTKKKFKFLHISSAHYRKGVDLLLKAYREEFSNKDDVCLILKLFTNSNIDLNKELELFKSKSAPELLIINNPELTDGQIAELYRKCDAVVLPSRAEGFGIPMAEAMLMQKPLITTNYGGQLDFCSQDNSFLLDYKLLPSKSHLGIPGAYLAEPDFLELKKLMRYLFLNSKSNEVTQKVNKAYVDVKKLTWKKSATKAIAFINYLEKIKHLKNKNLGVISHFNTQGGIAEYTNELFSSIECSFKNTYYLANKDIYKPFTKDNNNVLRCWSSISSDFSELIRQIKQKKIDIVHIQHHLNITNIDTLKVLLNDLLKLNIQLLVTLHVVDVGSANWQKVNKELSRVSKVFVHSKKDQLALKNAGINSEIFNFGILDFFTEDKKVLRKAFSIKSKHVISTHGLIHDKKGFLELIKATAILKNDFADILLLAVTANNPANLSSTSTFKKMLGLIDKLKLNNNVFLINAYLENQQIISLLQISDFVVLPYHDLSEGASGGVRKSIASARPIVLTASQIFNDLKIGYKIKDNNPKTIANAISELFKNSETLLALEKDTKEYINQNLWDKISQNYLTKLSS